MSLFGLAFLLYDFFFLIPSWHSDVVTTLSQRCDTVENESCANIGFWRCDNVALRRYQDVATTLLQRRHNMCQLGQFASDIKLINQLASTKDVNVLASIK